MSKEMRGVGDSKTLLETYEAGIYTEEGNAAGTRAGLLAKQREDQLRDFTEKKRKLAESAQKLSLKDFDKKFRSETLNPALSSDL